MINLNVGSLDKVTTDCIQSFFDGIDTFSLISVRSGIILLCHGNKDGQISDIVIRMVRMAKRRDDNIAVICCYPAKVKSRYPDISDNVLGNWYDITNISILQSGHIRIYPNSEIIH